MTAVTGKVKIPRANPIQLKRVYTSEHKNPDDRRFVETIIQGGSSQHYRQPWLNTESVNLQFYSTFGVHTAELLDCENAQKFYDGESYTAESSLSVSQVAQYRGLKYYSDCQVKERNGFLVIYFENGYTYTDDTFGTTVDEINLNGTLPELAQNVDDLVGKAISVTYLSTTENGLITAIEFDIDADSEVLVTDIAIGSLEEKDGQVEITYDKINYDLYGFPVSFSGLEDIYYIALTLDITGNKVKYLSEPQEAFASFGKPVTTVVNYKHTGEYDSALEMGYLYEGAYLNKIRFYGDFAKTQASGDVVNYDDDRASLTKLRGIEHTLMTLSINDVPGYLARQILNILSHDTKVINEYYWENDDYGDIEEIELTDLNSFSVPLRQVNDNRYSTTELSSTATAAFTPDEFNSVDELGDTLNTSFASNLTSNFELIDSPAWISVDEEIISNGDSIVITVSTNAGNEIFRDYTLQYQSVEYPSLIAEVYVYQLQDYTIPTNSLRTTPADGSTLNFIPAGETKRISVQATGTYTIIISSGFTYNVVSPTKVDVTAPLNSTGSTINANIAFVLDADNNITSSLDIVQDSIPSLISSSPTSATIPVGGGSASFSITADAECNWEVVENSSWLSVNKNNGDGSESINVTVIANSGGERSAIIVIRNIDYRGDTLSLTIYQSGQSGGGSGPVPQPV